MTAKTLPIVAAASLAIAAPVNGSTEDAGVAPVAVADATPPVTTGTTMDTEVVEIMAGVLAAATEEEDSTVGRGSTVVATTEEGLTMDRGSTEVNAAALVDASMLDRGSTEVNSAALVDASMLEEVVAGAAEEEEERAAQIAAVTCRVFAASDAEQELKTQGVAAVVIPD